MGLDRAVERVGTGAWGVSFCENCDGRRCMSCVLREIHGSCIDDCPSCCPTPQPALTRLAAEVDDLGTRYVEQRERADRADEEARRLRTRTHEIQAEEMEKRAALDKEIGQLRRFVDEARAWTEENRLTADWAADPTKPWWGMTSQHNRMALVGLVLERDAAEEHAQALEALLREKDEAIGELLETIRYEKSQSFDARAAGEDLLDPVSDLGWA